MHRTRRNRALTAVVVCALAATAHADCPGDLNGDDAVDLADLGIVLASYNNDAGGDIDGDGDTDLADLGILLAAYGTVCPDVDFVVRHLTFDGENYDVTIDCQFGNCSAYPTPHYRDLNADGDPDDANERSYPVAYVRNTSVVIDDLEFTIIGDPPDAPVPVIGQGPDGMTFTGTGTVSNDRLVVDEQLVSSVPLPDYVNFYDTFDIAWQVAWDGLNYVDAGMSRNPLYVTYDEPFGRRLESFFDISCRAAVSHSAGQDVIDAIWAGFADLDVRNARGERMGYYRDVLCSSDCTIYDAQGLVIELNGQCGSWADLFRQCLRTQGFGNSSFITVEPTNWAGILVNNYQFIGNGTSGSTNYPYKLNSPCGGPQWAGGPECLDQDGLPGQDESNPASYFSRHFIVKINGRYYDPSYGAGPFTGTTHQATLQWEDAGLAGYHGSYGSYRAARKDTKGVRETYFSN
jgi:hypothetical protein